MSAFPTSPPPDLESKAFVLPEPINMALSGGTRLKFVRNEQAPMVIIRVIIRSAAEHCAEPFGMASAVARLMASGTSGKSSFEIADEANRYGGGVSASASSDYAVLSISCLSAYLDPMMKLAGEVLSDSIYPEHEVEIDRANLIQRLRAQRAEPGFLAAEKYAQAAYPGHPYSMVSPSEEDVLQWTAEQMREERQALFRSGASNAIIVAVGDAEPENLKAAIERHWSNWLASTTEPEDFIQPMLPNESGEIWVQRPRSAQCNLRIGCRAPTRTDDEFTPLNIATVILGGSASSRLFLNVREDLGYAYHVGARLSARLRAGSMIVEAETAQENVRHAIQEIHREINRMANDGPTEQELSTIKAYMTGQLAMRWITQGGIADTLLVSEAFGLPDDYWQTQPERIRQTTAEQARQAFANRLDLERLITVGVGESP